MTIKSTLAAGFTAAMLALATSPASANANTANNALDTAGSSTAALLDVTPSSYRYYVCNCARVRYVRYYRVRYVRYVYRYYY